MNTLFQEPPGKCLAVHEVKMGSITKDPLSGRLRDCHLLVEFVDERGHVFYIRSFVETISDSFLRDSRAETGREEFSSLAEAFQRWKRLKVY